MTSIRKPLSERDRARLRKLLPAGIERLRKQLAVAERALSGVDPEAAFGYLASMADHLGAMVKAHRRAALAALGDHDAPRWAVLTLSLGLSAEEIGAEWMRRRRRRRAA